RELGRCRFGLPNTCDSGRDDLHVAGHLKPPQGLAVAAARDEQRPSDLHAYVVAAERFLGESAGRLVKDGPQPTPMTPRAARSNAEHHLAVRVPRPRALLPHVELKLTRGAGRL